MAKETMEPQTAEIRTVQSGDPTPVAPAANQGAVGDGTAENLPKSGEASHGPKSSQQRTQKRTKKSETKHKTSIVRNVEAAAVATQTAALAKSSGSGGNAQKEQKPNPEGSSPDATRGESLPPGGEILTATVTLAPQPVSSSRTGTLSRLEQSAGDSGQSTPGEDKAFLPPGKGKRPVVLVALVIGVVLVVVLAVILSRRGKEPGQDPALLQRRQDMMDVLGLSQPQVTASEDRRNALQWIVEEDPLQLGIPTEDPLQAKDDPLVSNLRERYTLALFYFATHGDEWERDYGFLSELEVCQWSFVDPDDPLNVHGVLCDETGRVTNIVLPWNNLSGTLPEELSVFSDSLLELNLGGGSIGGTIPSALGKLSKLQMVSLSDNCLTGSIPPELAGLDSLGAANFNNNNDQLSGSLQFFCDASNPSLLRTGVFAVWRDASVDCTCCLSCQPDTYECGVPDGSASWPSLMTAETLNYDPRGNLKQFQSQCLTSVQDEWIEEHCPCVINLSADPSLCYACGCSDCSEPDAWPSRFN